MSSQRLANRIRESCLGDDSESVKCDALKVEEEINFVKIKKKSARPPSVRFSMAQDIILSFFLYFLLFVIQTPNANSFPLGDVKKDSTDCSGCSDSGKKLKLDGGVFVREPKRYVSLSRNPSKYAYSKTPKGLNYFLLKGWGARGMPFNVLYTPNIQQQKMMKSVPKNSAKGKFIKGPKHMPEIYDLVLEDEKHSRKKPENTSKKPLTPRKYYSLIPQLFVSYGW